MNDAQAAFHVSFGRESLAALARNLETGIFMVMSMICHTASWFECCGWILAVEP
jgi:hypothetical protein